MNASLVTTKHDFIPELTSFTVKFKNVNAELFFKVVDYFGATNPDIYLNGHRHVSQDDFKVVGIVKTNIKRVSYWLNVNHLHDYKWYYKR